MDYAERFTEAFLWVGGPLGDMKNREFLPVDEENLLRYYEFNKEVLFPLDVPNQAARELVIQELVTQVGDILGLLRKRDRS